MTIRNSRSERGPAARRAGSRADQARKRPVISMGWDDFDEVTPVPARTDRDYKSGRWRGPAGILRFALLFALVGGLIGGGLWFFVRPWAVDAVVDWAAENPTALKVPWVADIVRAGLHDDLTQPADPNDASEVAFSVVAGETSKQIGRDLVQAGLVKDERAFVFQSIERGLTSGFIAGDYSLRKNMTVDQIITLLTTPKPPEPTVRITFREGDRIEQLAAVIEIKEANPDNPSIRLSVDPKEFYELAMHPPAELLADYPWLKLPAGASLEGFLFPDTYIVGPDISAEDFIRRMLNAFEAKAPAGLLDLSPEQLYQTVRIASIVEKETAVAAERPIIAGVYLNRLNPKMWPTGLLEADPTVYYANDGVWLSDPGHPIETWVERTFWVPVGGSGYSKLDFGAPWDAYNTYKHKGLPPTPICSPGAASLAGALAPNTTDGYLYFVAKNDGSGTHAFARTLAEHEANKATYGY
jgi:UPF0755 protein